LSTATLRCAVYTRKSSEEGLDQAFNSLDAQREAGRDYIKSQKHQGWVPVATAYDDGGYSGGSMERPALKKLLEDIQRRRVDVVLVYKVDRLSRSLADFARLMQVFDEHKVSFVSVTQQFNTTTSMGRLTLNMLLSFAQFEREVTGERIRDKIAATKRTGAWVCGQPPLGYRVANASDGVTDRRLVVVEPEAEIVREAFRSYIELRSPLEVAQRLNNAGHTTRRWTSSRGVEHGGRRFNALLVYRMLNNRTYEGKITHRRGSTLQVHPGLHQPIIDLETWENAQAASNTVKRETSVRWTHTHLLRGKLRSFEGYAMSPASVSKRAVDGSVRRIRYYCSQKGIKHGYQSCPIKTINAHNLDDLVRALALDHLLSTHRLDLRDVDAASRDHWIREAIQRVVVSPETIVVETEPLGIEACKRAARELPKPADLTHTETPGEDGTLQPATIPKCAFTPDVEERDGRTVLTIHIKIKRHDKRRLLVAPDGRDLLLRYSLAGRPIPPEHLVRALGRAFALHREIVERRLSIDAAAQEMGLSSARGHYLLHLTRLGPEVIRAVLTGHIGPSTSLKDLHAAAAHLDWSLQAAMLLIKTPAEI